MKTYKETLGIIKRATPFVNLPLTGPITAGVNRAADDIARGLDMQGALRTAVQVPQQAGSNFLSGIGNWMPLLFGMGGLGSLFNSNNTQIQPQPQKQVPTQTAQPAGAQVPPTPLNIPDVNKFLSSPVNTKDNTQLQQQMAQAKSIGKNVSAYDAWKDPSQDIQKLNEDSGTFDVWDKLYRREKKNPLGGPDQLKKLRDKRMSAYRDQVKRIKQLGQKSWWDVWV